MRCREALCDTLGQLEILGWRDHATAGNGNREAVQIFHDRLLELGSLPLPALERELALADTPPAGRR